MHKLLLPLVLLVCCFTSLFAVSSANATPPPNHRVTLCHATASNTNPYVKITVDVAAVFRQGHDAHTPGGRADIIPPFTYTDRNGVAHSYPGRSWDATGQAIFNNGCNVPTPTPPCTVDCTPPCTVDCTPPCTVDCTPEPTCTVDCTPDGVPNPPTTDNPPTDEPPVVDTPRAVDVPREAAHVPVGAELPYTGVGGGVLAFLGLLGLACVGLGVYLHRVGR